MTQTARPTGPRPARPAAACVLVGLLAALAPAAPAGAAEAGRNVARGEYLARIMDCGGCHTTGALLGRPDAARYLAGSEVGFEIPGLGIFYPPNLTPDPADGLGSWSEADIVTVLRTGMRPDGRQLAPAMPWRSYAALTDDDATSLAAFLRSLPPVPGPAPAHVGHAEKPTAPYMTVVMPAQAK